MKSFSLAGCGGLAMLAGVVLVVGAQASARAQAQNYPIKPIRVIMPTAPGSPPDYALRVLATKMSERIGEPIIVENRSGAGGTLGAAVAAKSAPDGYTIMMGSITSLSIGPALFPSAGIDPVKMFAPIIQRLNMETRRGADTKEMREIMAGQGGEVLWSTPEQFGKLIADEAVKWAKAVALSGANTN